MSANNLNKLNDKLFAQLDRLEDVDLTNNEALMAELARTKATVSISREIIDNAALVLEAHVAREESFAKDYELPEMLRIESKKSK